MKFSPSFAFLYFLMVSPSEAFLSWKPPSKLTILRKNVDFLDDRLYSLLSFRKQLVQQIKIETEEAYDHERDAEILERLSSKKQLKDDYVEQLWKLIFWNSFYHHP